ncbi:MAG: DUF2345 domain-containing protein, partial [Azoarcus sp.]|nr:DUF2345 domain-containing protein [Azoarcus sp.]
NFLAKLNITNTGKRVVIEAEKEVEIVGGTSYTRWTASGIEGGTMGVWREQAASHTLTGPDSLSVPPMNLPELAGDYSIKYQFFDRHTGQPLAQHRYKLVEENGTVHEGVTDEQGWAELVSTPDMQTVKAWVAEFPTDMDPISRGDLI